jgi:fibronectin type 3 domain-containing protein
MPPTVPPVPTGLTATAGVQQVTLIWNASTGASSYHVKRSLTSGSEVTVATVSSPTTTFTDTGPGIVNGTLYFYVVSALNSAGESANSVEVSTRPNIPPAPPTGLAAAPGTTQISLTWNANIESNLAGYNIYRSTSSGGPFTVRLNSSLVVTTSYTDTGLTDGTTYFYVVRAVNNSNQESGNSNQASETPNPPPPAPTGLVATAGNAQISLQWNADPTATAYNVYRGSSPGGPYDTVVANGVIGTAYVDATVTNGTTYYYVVRALNGTEQSFTSKEASATPHGPPPAPTNLTAVPSNTKVTLTWSASPGATSYTVKMATTSTGPYTVVASVTGTSYVALNLNDGTPYFFVVTSSGPNGESTASGQASATPAVPQAPPKPTNVTATPGPGRINLSWTATSNTTGYTVKRSLAAGGPFTAISTDQFPTTYEDIDVTAGTTYYYVIVALNDTVEGPPSAVVSATPDPPGPPAPQGLIAARSLIIGSLTIGKVQLSWTGNGDAWAYNVKRWNPQDGTFTNLTVRTPLTTYTDRNLALGQTYHYQVTALDGVGESDPVDTSITVVYPFRIPSHFPGVPQVAVQALPLDGQVLLNWTPGDFATDYLIYRTDPDGTRFLLSAQDDLFLTDTSVVNELFPGGCDVWCGRRTFFFFFLMIRRPPRSTPMK